MIDYLNYHKSPIFLSSREGRGFDGLSFKTTRNTYHPFHFHDGVEIMYVHKGVILVNAFNVVETVKEGQFIVHDPYVIHSAESITSDTVVTCINISGEYIDENDGLISSIVQRVADTKEYVRLRNDILEWIYMGFMSGTTTDKMLWQMKKIFPSLQKFMSVALLNTNEKSTVVQEGEKDHERLTRIINYLFNHHDETITLDSISSELYISKYYLSHYIKRAFGYTMKQALSYFRSEESTIDLLGSKMAIGEIASKHGFTSVRSYNEAFPRYYGISPSEYRRRHQKETVLFQDFVGEEVGLDFSDSEEKVVSNIHSNHERSITINLPTGSYEVLSTESENESISKRIGHLNDKNRDIEMDCHCEELILRVKKQ
ncbi:MAG: helix-turn-helix transcriptional regulator [Firmicutes bacterium]|nr:helix-turn-helix transcriptional regulator [Bacillota bacterium]